MNLFQVDAFANQIFKGNPAAVCPLETWLPDEILQNIAAENNLAETAFFVAEGNHFHLRWFTPAIEVDLCGHATLASAHVLFEHLSFPDSTIHFQTRSGLLTVSRHPKGYTMDFPADQLQAVATPSTIVAALGLTPTQCFRGRDDYMVVVDLQEKIENLNPDFRLLKQVDARGLIVTAPGKEVDFVSRCFFPAAGIDEDPVTGSAHTSMAPYWSQQLGKTELTAQQLSKRGGTVHCEVKADRVLLSGPAVTYLIGNIPGF